MGRINGSIHPDDLDMEVSKVRAFRLAEEVVQFAEELKKRALELQEEIASGRIRDDS